MKKTLALMLTLLMLVGLCAGCGNGSNGNKNCWGTHGLT